MTSAPTLRERRTRETRQLILDAAYAVFARRGYGGAAVDEILAEAAISKGAFYHHFASKEAVFQSLLSERARRCTEAMAGAVDADASLSENVRNLLRAGWKLLTSDPAWANIQMEFWVHATREEWARVSLAELLSQCRQFLAQGIDRGRANGTIRSQLDPQAAARLILALSDGIMIQWQIQPNDVDLDGLIESMAEMITLYLTCTQETVRPAKKGAR